MESKGPVSFLTRVRLITGYTELFSFFPYIVFSQSFIDDFRVALPPSTNLSTLNYLNVSDKPGTFPIMITLLRLTTKNHSLDIQNSQYFFLENLALRQNFVVLNSVIQNSSDFKAKSF